MKQRIIACLMLATLVFSANTYAHQTYLIAQEYDLLAGKDNYLALFNGTYYESGYSITKKMSRDISIVAGGVRKGIDDVNGGRVSDVDTSPSLVATYIGLVAEPDGTGLAGVAAHPDLIALPVPLFREYLLHDGLLDMLEQFDKSDPPPVIRERYTKHAKGIFQVGDKLTDDYKMVLGYKAEIVPEKHPGRLSAGDSMTALVLFDGKPAPNQIVYASHQSFKPNFDGRVTEGALYALRTDENGRVTFKITVADKWYMQLIHMQKVDEEEVDYESNWTTLTFDIQ